MNVTLLRRWGNHQPGATVQVEAVQGRWLVDHAFGTASGVQAPEQAAFMPGEAGADPLASGDGTRRGNPAMVKGPRRDGNNALPVPGSPVQYNVGVAESAGNESANGENPDGNPSGPSSKVSGSGRRRPKA